MSGQGLDVASKLGGCELNSRRGTSLVGRRVALVLSLVLLLLLGVASVASASSKFYWYGSGNSTCWQTGQPGSPSEACDSVGGEYLLQSGHTRTIHAGGSDYNVSPSSDYCTGYELGDYALGGLDKPDSMNQGPSTGFTTGVPYQAFQVSDANGSVCQAEGAAWGQEIRSGAPESGCYSPTCGMHHLVSLNSQADEPWSKAFGSQPALVVCRECGHRGVDRKRHHGRKTELWRLGI
jgi:hypothetical protein